MSLDRAIVKIIKRVGRCADREGLRCYLVGGFVRDILLKIKNFDIDVVLESDGIGFAQVLNKELKGQLLIHKRFGTAVIAREDFKIDIATLRKEYYPTAGSLPVVSPGSLADDLARRDFSINAVASSINSSDFGFVFDYFFGLDDIRGRRLSVLHKNSFLDDPTRILRLARFKGRLSFSIEPQTLHYLIQAREERALENVQKQRIRDELILIFKEPKPEEVVTCLKELYGLQFIHPALSFDQDKFKQLIEIRKVCDWFQRKFHRRRKLDIWIMYFTLLLSSLSATQLSRVASSLALTKGETKRLLSFKVDYHRVFNRLNSASLTPSYIYNILNPLAYEVILLCYSTVHSSLVKKYIKDFLERYNLMSLKVTGEDLKKLGVKPGPRFKQLLEKIAQKKLDSRLKTKGQELAFLKKLLAR